SETGSDGRLCGNERIPEVAETRSSIHPREIDRARRHAGDAVGQDTEVPAARHAARRRIVTIQLAANAWPLNRAEPAGPQAKMCRCAAKGPVRWKKKSSLSNASAASASSRSIDRKCRTRWTTPLWTRLGTCGAQGTHR